jgi:hypothetical protein
MNKSTLRNQISQDVESYLSHGGTIIVEKSYNPRKKNTANGKQKQYYTSTSPRKRPSLMYDFIEVKQ